MELGEFLKNPYAQCVICVFLIIGGYLVYRMLSRLTDIRDLPRNPRNYCFKGIVTSVSDGDGFKVFHVPWLRGSVYNRRSPKLSVRLAGVDAPESRYFSTPAQPFAKEAKEYLAQMILGKRVCVQVQSIDMYNRIVALVYIKRGWIFWDNVNLEMVKAGLACVYDRAGAEYGGCKEEFERAQAAAKKGRLGMWSSTNVVLPMDYKKARK